MICMYGHLNKASEHLRTYSNNEDKEVTNHNFTHIYLSQYNQIVNMLREVMNTHALVQIILLLPEGD
jgi:hypothetical protein